MKYYDSCAQPKIRAMDTLPPEVMIKIALLLPVRDVAVCCAVSLRWRDIFGSDPVWRPRCDVVIAQHLESTPCRVEPTFSSPLSDDTTLSPTGQWRLAFMREKHLWRNWIHGNYKKQKLDVVVEGRVSVLNPNTLIALGCKVITLIDISVDPPRTAQFKPAGYTFIPYREEEFFEIQDVPINMIVKVDKEKNILVSVDKKKNILRIFDIDVDKFTVSSRPKSSFCLSVIDGEHFDIVKSIYLGWGDKYIHILDLVNGTVLKSELPPGWQSRSITQSKDCEDVLIIDDNFQCLMFNTRQLRFWPLKVVSQPSTIVSGCAIITDYVAMILNKSLRVYNYKTSQLLFEVASPSLPFHVRLNEFKDSFMYMTQDGLLKQVFPSTGLVRLITESRILDFYPIAGNLVITILADLVWSNGIPVNKTLRVGPPDGSIVESQLGSRFFQDGIEFDEAFSKTLKQKLKSRIAEFAGPKELELELCYFW